MKTLLVANRGEIAHRIMRTAKAMGLRTIAVFSDADTDAPHVRFADDAVPLGPGPVGDSYLRGDRIIDAARKTGADAIHPGYGFLSENADFVRSVEAAGLTFVGPTADAVEVMGDKARAKRRMSEAGVPCVPGYAGEDDSQDKLQAAADEIGFPVMVKAAAGGGGRGMRLVKDRTTLVDALTVARAEAERAFGSGALIIERAIVRPRHVEIQVFADENGHTIHLGERDCSVQRRHQKIIEEAPCPVLEPEQRGQMGAAAVAAAKAVGYRGAGTVEFLLDTDGRFYFLEMNTRLQVEHPVTEMVTGLDLVELQLRVTEGARLPLSQDDVHIDGHAIEVRLCAEDPAQDFLPCTGTVLAWEPPAGPGIRVDAGIETNSVISPFYDAMVAKVIAHGHDRNEARRRLIRALEGTAILGVPTNRDFLIEALSQPAFVAGRATTAFIDDSYGQRGYRSPKPAIEDLALAAVVSRCQQRAGALGRTVGVHPELVEWSNTGSVESLHTYRLGDRIIELRVEAAGRDAYWVHGDGVKLELSVLAHDGQRWKLSCQGRIRSVVVAADGAQGGQRSVWLSVDGKTHLLVEGRASFEDAEGSTGGRVVAPMHGKLFELFVVDGQAVSKGERIAVLEAMKMHLEIVAPIDGTVVEVAAPIGSQVAADDLLLSILPT